jgi:hypothetical protein
MLASAACGLKQSSVWHRRKKVLNGSCVVCFVVNERDGRRPRLWIPYSVEVLQQNCFLDCTLFASIAFHAHSKLSRLEKAAFRGSGLETITIPSSVEVLCEQYFFECSSLESITFNATSRLSRFEKEGFYGSG